MACLSGVSSLMVLISFVCMRLGHLSGQAIKFCERVALERILAIWKKKITVLLTLRGIDYEHIESNFVSRVIFLHQKGKTPKQH
jgi:hypothetical protein